MQLTVIPVMFQPGAVAAGTAIDLPANHPVAAAVVGARIWRYDHSHVAGGAEATATAADSTTFVPLLNGAGTAVTGVGISNAGGASSNITWDTSTTTGIPAEVAVTATLGAGGTSVTLSVATEANDLLVLDLVPPGALPQI